MGLGNDYQKMLKLSDGRLMEIYNGCLRLTTLEHMNACSHPSL